MEGVSLSIRNRAAFLRAFKPSDLSDLFAYASVKGVGEMAGWPHHTSEEISKTVLNSFIKKDEVYAMVDKTNHRVIGSFGIHAACAVLKAKHPNMHLKDIGFVLAKQHWGKGLIVEAAHAVINHCFDVWGLDALSVSHFDDNQQSKRVVQKLGFEYVLHEDVFIEMINQEKTLYRYILFNPSSADTSK